MFLIIFIVIGC